MERSWPMRASKLASCLQKGRLRRHLQCNIGEPNVSKFTTGVRSCKWEARWKIEWYSSVSPSRDPACAATSFTPVAQLVIQKASCSHMIIWLGSGRAITSRNMSQYSSSLPGKNCHPSEWSLSYQCPISLLRWPICLVYWSVVDRFSWRLLDKDMSMKTFMKFSR